MPLGQSTQLTPVAHCLLPTVKSRRAGERALRYLGPDGI
jgi:hypothetical protein